MKFELFGRLKKHSAPSAPARVREPPIEKVKEYAASGMPEADIIKTLKNAGYSFREIDAALNSALKTGVGTEAYRENAPIEESAQEEEITEPLKVLPQESEIVAPQVFAGDDEGSEKINVEELEEIVNSIADEKMREFKISIEKSGNSINEFAERLTAVSNGLESIKAAGENANAETEKKIGELHAKLDELEPKTLGLERAFKDIMPNLVDSVREVKEALHGMQKKGGAAKSEEKLDDDFLNSDGNDEFVDKLK